MTARPDAPELSAAERQRVDRIEAAPVAEESWFVRKAIAAELRAVAHRLDDGGDEAIEVALGGAAYVHRVLCDRAHEIDGES